MLLTGLQSVADRGALYAFLNQSILGDELEQRLGEHNWDADLSERRITFSSNATGATMDGTADLVASIAAGPRSLLWGWAHPQRTGELTDRLRAYGQEHGIPQLVEPEVRLPTQAQGEQLSDAIDALSHDVGRVTVALLGVPHYYSAPVGTGSRVVLAVSGLDVPALRLDHRIPTRVSQALGAGDIRDHRGAMHGLAELAGWQIHWDPQWSRAQVTDPVTGNSVVAAFDEHARLTSLQAMLAP